MKIVRNGIEWPLCDKLEPLDFALNQQIERLNGILSYYEAVWNIGELEKRAKNEIVEKWRVHVQKLHQALLTKNLPDYTALVDGAARGLAALEKSTLENGHTPPAQDAWRAKCAHGEVYICRDKTQADAMHKLGYEVLTLEGAANLFFENKKQIALLKKW